jgi:hypothetical protein
MKNDAEFTSKEKGELLRAIEKANRQELLTEGEATLLARYEFLVQENLYKLDDEVNSPRHYTSGSIEVIDYIIDQGFGEGFCLGNAMKYISRAGKKDPSKKIQDLEKAAWYLNKWIGHLKKTSQKS